MLLPVIVFVVWFILQLLFHQRASGKVFVISHKGLHETAPENSASAVREAIRAGVTHVEIDVRRTRDNVLVVIHDKAVDRITDGSGYVHELAWAQISRLKTKDQMDQISGHPIPQLREILELVRQSEVFLVLEVKDPSLYPGIESQILEEIGEFDLEDHVIVISFDHSSLKNFESKVSTGGLSVWALAPAPCDGVDFVDVHWSNVILDPTLAYRVHRNNCKLVVWTVNSPWIMKLMAGLGVDGITTDNIQGWRDSFQLEK